MQAFCFGCADQTIITPRGQCSWCDEQIMQVPQHKSRRGTGHQSYIGNEAFYEACYARYIEVRSLRSVARDVWEDAGYTSLKSCHNTLWEAFRVRGWMLYTRSYTRTKHGLARREHANAEWRHAQRVQRGEIRGVACQATRTQYPRKGQPCGRPALDGESYCHAHHPKYRAWRVEHLARIRHPHHDLQEAA